MNERMNPHEQPYRVVVSQEYRFADEDSARRFIETNYLAFTAEVYAGDDLLVRYEGTPEVSQS